MREDKFQVAIDHMEVYYIMLLVRCFLCTAFLETWKKNKVIKKA